MSENAISLFSFIGYLFGGYSGMVGAYVILRWGTTGVAAIWRQRASIDKMVEDELKIKIGE